MFAGWSENAGLSIRLWGCFETLSGASLVPQRVFPDSPAFGGGEPHRDPEIELDAPVRFGVGNRKKNENGAKNINAAKIFLEI